MEVEGALGRSKATREKCWAPDSFIVENVWCRAPQNKFTLYDSILFYVIRYVIRVPLYPGFNDYYDLNENK